MPERIAHAIAATIAHALKTEDGLPDIAPHPAEPETGYSLTLADNPDLAAIVSHVVACSPALDGRLLDFPSFCRTLTEEPTRPRKPTADDIDRAANARGYRGTKLVAYREWLTVKAENDYFLALSAYEALEARRLDFHHRYAPDIPGYLSFLLAHCPEAYPFFSAWRYSIPIREKDRERHTYVTGGSGSGKTEALKVLVHHYVTRNTGTAVVILDPHGDLAEEVAAWKENATGDRLVYIDPALQAGVFPSFNPLELKPEQCTPEGVDKAVEQFIGVFEEVMGRDFSPQMETILRACLATLLQRPGSTLLDLLTFMDDNRNDPLLAYADRYLFNDNYRATLKTAFRLDAYNPTKISISTKLRNIIDPMIISRFLNNPSTFDLEALLDRRALMIFNLSEGRIGTSANVIGRFILAKLGFLALARQSIEKDDRVPCHVFVDECQLYISKTIDKILGQARKYKVYLTLAQQIVGQDMTNDLEKMVLGNTGVKITGSNGIASLAIMARETETDAKELQRLKPGCFSVWTRGRSVFVRMPRSRVGRRGAMSADAWERVKAEQIARYYRAPVRKPGEAPPGKDQAAGTGEKRPSRTATPEPMPADERDTAPESAVHANRQQAEAPDGFAFPIDH